MSHFMEHFQKRLSSLRNQAIDELKQLVLAVAGGRHDNGGDYVSFRICRIDGRPSLYGPALYENNTLDEIRVGRKDGKVSFMVGSGNITKSVAAAEVSAWSLVILLQWLIENRDKINELYP